MVETEEPGCQRSFTTDNHLNQDSDPEKTYMLPFLLHRRRSSLYQALKHLKSCKEWY